MSFPSGIATSIDFKLNAEAPRIVKNFPFPLRVFFGIGIVRGSSTRNGASGLLDMIRDDSSTHLLFTPDGPRGPRAKVQDGVLGLAAASGRPIYPVTLDYDRFWELPSWDRFQIPQPGAVCRVVVGPAVAAPKSLETAELDRVRGELEQALGC